MDRWGPEESSLHWTMSKKTIYRFISSKAKEPFWYKTLSALKKEHSGHGYIITALAEDSLLEDAGKSKFKLKYGVRVPVSSIYKYNKSTVSGPKGYLHIQTLQSILSGGVKYKKMPAEKGGIVKVKTQLGEEVPIAILLRSLSAANKKIEITREPLADVPLLFDGKKWTPAGEEILRQAYENMGLSEPATD